MYFDDFQLGATFEIPPAVIEKEKMMAFAKRYDNIPIHTDEEYAKKTHFGRLISPGVISFMTVWANYLESVDLAGDQLIAGKSTKIEWLKPVYAGDVLTGKGRVTKLQKRSQRNGLAEIIIEVYNQKGDLVIVNTTEMVVKCRE